MKGIHAAILMASAIGAGSLGYQLEDPNPRAGTPTYRHRKRSHSACHTRKSGSNRAAKQARKKNRNTK